MNPWLWIAFLALAGTLIVLDLVVLTRRPRAVSPAEGRASVALWVLAAVAFSFLLGHVYHTNWQQLANLVSDPIDNKQLDGPGARLQFITCYVLELALSIDNIAVLALLYSFFRIPPALLARVLFWSALISLSARFGLVMGAASLLRALDWFHWVLGGVLVLAMLRMLVMPDENTDFERRWPVRMVRRLLSVGSGYSDQRLTTRVDGKRVMTPLLLVVLAGAIFDITFAADSVPALFSVTRDPFIAFTASAFAILGMRSLYFAVAASVARFRYLKISLVAVLMFVAVKMLLARFNQQEYGNVPTIVTLAVVGGVMMLGIGASVLRNRVTAPAQPVPEPRPAVIEDLSEAVEATRRNLRKVLILIAGTSVIIFGIIIAPLPGPGPTILVPIGLALLATEFVWARMLLNRLKSGAFNLSDKADAFVDRTTVLVVPLLLVGWWLLAWGVGHWLHLKWYTVLIIFGSPFMPVAGWAANYFRTRFFKRKAPSQATPLNTPDAQPNPGADQTNSSKSSTTPAQSKSPSASSTPAGEPHSHA